MAITHADLVDKVSIVAARAVGGPTLTLAAGKGALVAAGSPTPEIPMPIIVYRGATYLTILRCEGVAGDVLTINGTMFGKADAAIQLGDVAYNAPTAGDLKALWDAIAAVETTPGPPGVPGSVWREGSGAPADALGVDGDYYLDGSTGDVHLRSSGAYAIVANIKGPKGDKGDAGATGADGAQGPAGVGSFGVSMPPGFAVSGSPLTSSGTIAVSTALSGMLKGTGSGFTAATAGTDFVRPSDSITGTASNITGTAAVDHGGTGLTSVGSANQVMGVDAAGAAIEYKTITAGANVTVTHAAGSVTIAATGGGSGAVTSVGLTAPSTLFSVSGSPVTTSGSLTFALVSQGANVVFAGPASGIGGVPSFRAMVAADVPALAQSKITNLVTDLAAKAADSAVVHLTGAETIAGTKTFSSPIAGDVTGTASNVTGTVAVANGGTGLTSLGTANQVAGVDAAGTGLEYKTLTAGSGVTITHAANSVTIAASGGGSGTGAVTFADDATAHSSTISTTMKELVLAQTGDDLGTIEVHLINRAGQAGVKYVQKGTGGGAGNAYPLDAMFANDDAQLTQRFESRSAYAYTVDTDSDGIAPELQYGPVGSPTFVAGANNSLSFGGLLVASALVRAFGMAPNATLDVRGDVCLQRGTYNANVSLPGGSCILGVDSSAGPVTVTTTLMPAGHIRWIKDEAGSAATNNITVATSGGGTIDGAASVAISVNYGWLMLYSKGSNNWAVIGKG